MSQSKNGYSRCIKHFPNNNVPVSLNHQQNKSKTSGLILGFSTALYQYLTDLQTRQLAREYGTVNKCNLSEQISQK